MSHRRRPVPRHGGSCLAHHPQYIDNVIEVQYSTGLHRPRRARARPAFERCRARRRDLTWTVVLPSERLVRRSMRPARPSGSAGRSPIRTSLFGQAFVELQFYPNTIVTNCNPNGSFIPKFSAERLHRVLARLERHDDRAAGELP